MTLYTDDDVDRAIAAYLNEREQTPFTADHVTAVLDAVLPAYRKRLLLELVEEWQDWAHTDDGWGDEMRRKAEETP